MSIEEFPENFAPKEEGPVPVTPEAPSEAKGVEQGPQEKVIDDPTILGKRAGIIEAIKTGFVALQEDASRTIENIQTVSNTLGLEHVPPETPAQTITAESIEKAERELVTAEANYPGDWTLLLKERLLHLITQEKLDAVFATHQAGFKDGAPGTFDKPEHFKSFLEQQTQTLPARVEDRFQATGVASAQEHARPTSALGIANFNLNPSTEKPDDLIHSGVVFSDATTKEGVPLTPRQKNIIEAHEKGHGIRKFTGPAAAEIRSVLDPEILATLEVKMNYITNPDEIIERMSQLKNYFGYKAGEQITDAHLNHAKEHYVKDTGLDNGMSAFFEAITDKTQDSFLHVMNSYPI